MWLVAAEPSIRCPTPPFGCPPSMVMDPRACCLVACGRESSTGAVCTNAVTVCTAGHPLQSINRSCAPRVPDYCLQEGHGHVGWQEPWRRHAHGCRFTLHSMNMSPLEVSVTPCRHVQPPTGVALVMCVTSCTSFRFGPSPTSRGVGRQRQPLTPWCIRNITRGRTPLVITSELASKVYLPIESPCDMDGRGWRACLR